MANQYTQAIKDAREKRHAYIDAADSLSRKPKTVFVLPESRQTKINRERLGDSIEDILTRAHAMGFLSEAGIRNKMRELSSLINAPRRTR